MALWIMGFGGTVPLGVLVAGRFAKRLDGGNARRRGLGAWCSRVVERSSLRAKGAPDD